MNRETLFRGMSIEFDRWVYGFLIRYIDPSVEKATFGDALIYEGVNIKPPEKVHQKSIGEFTGLYDATKWEELTEPEQSVWRDLGNTPEEWKGWRIFEGDIIQINDIGKRDHRELFVVKYTDWDASFSLFPAANPDCHPDAARFIAKYEVEHYKRIGNIYQHSELLEI